MVDQPLMILQKMQEASDLSLEISAETYPTVVDGYYFTAIAIRECRETRRWHRHAP